MQSNADTTSIRQTLRRERELLSIALERNTLCEALIVENDRLRQAAKAQAAAPATPAPQPAASAAEQE